MLNHLISHQLPPKHQVCALDWNQQLHLVSLTVKQVIRPSHEGRQSVKRQLQNVTPLQHISTESNTTRNQVTHQNDGLVFND